jgi:predicted enzyme related to lactoylglutathione lyase
MPRTEIQGGRIVVIIQDTEGNGICLWKPAKNE